MSEPSTSDRISKVQRWLDLISFLVGHRFPVDVDDVMENVPAYAGRWRGGDETDRASVRRMFERDKDELRELGVPLETVEYSINFGTENAEGYRLAREDFYLPYLRLLSEARGEERSEEASGDGAFELREDEATAALDGLRLIAGRPTFPLADDARSALRKLTFDLDDDAVERTPVLWMDPPEDAGRSSHLEALSDALLRRKFVRFTYHGIGRDERTEREVEPWGLLFQHSHWYLVGHDRDREARRTFRVARMEEVEVNARSPASPDYRIPEEFDLGGLRGLDAWELGEEEPIEARVRFAFPRSLWAERNERGELVRREDDGAQLRAFRVVQPNPFLRWILSMAGEARILEPPELVRGFEEMARRVAELYRADTTDAGPGEPRTGREDDGDA